MPKLEIIEVKNHGKAAEEYILFKATQNINLKNFMICDTTYTSEKTISNKFRHTYWFLSKEIKSGEYVVLYTKNGSYERTTNNGNIFHKYYWNSSAPIWNDAGDAAIVFEIATYNVKRAR